MKVATPVPVDTPLALVNVPLIGAAANDTMSVRSTNVTVKGLSAVKVKSGAAVNFINGLSTFPVNVVVATTSKTGLVKAMGEKTTLVLAKGVKSFTKGAVSSTLALLNMIC